MNIIKNFSELKNKTKIELNEDIKNKVIKNILSFNMDIVKNLISNLDLDKKTSLLLKGGYETVNNLLKSGGGFLKEDFSLDEIKTMNKEEKEFAKEVQIIIINNIKSLNEHENCILIVKQNDNEAMAMTHLQFLLKKSFDNLIEQPVHKIKSKIS